jgi:hypothetical protein
MIAFTKNNEYVIINVYSRQQWFRIRASVLRYAYFVSLVALLTRRNRICLPKNVVQNSVRADFELDIN